MKRIRIILWLIFVSTTMVAQTDYYWYKQQKIYLDLNPYLKYVLLDGIDNIAQLDLMIGNADVQVIEFGQTNVLSSLHASASLTYQETNWAVVKSEHMPLPDLSASPNVIYESPFFLTKDQDDLGTSHLFYVKLLQKQDLPLLENLARNNNATILGSNKFMDLWYTVSCTKNSTGNAFELAKVFYESGLFAAAEPALMVFDLAQCVNDPIFPDQWGLLNTSQHGGTFGLDINACQAWVTTTGDPDIVVAVLDHGIELTHPDLTNLFPLSFDSETNSSPSVIRGNHGTACAGIIGATTDNNLGVAGIAPLSPLMSISNRLRLGPNAPQTLADGLNWAWQNGASVISNSWGHNGLTSMLIDDAITDALTLGRDGLGCVVVFAAGNSNGPVIYPASSNPDIIAVGANDDCGIRVDPFGGFSCLSWNSSQGSCFGPELDVVAPGILIPTTDLQGAAGYNRMAGTAGDYFDSFGGTSSACPHVAGVAALILSENPCLTQREVADIIEQTAQKVGPYVYQRTPGRDNGTWNNEMGYGLLDADQAVELARNIYLQNETEVGGPILYNAPYRIYAGRDVTPRIPMGDYQVLAGGHVTCLATDRVTLEPGFRAFPGSYFRATIGPVFSCMPTPKTGTLHDPGIPGEVEIPEIDAPAARGVRISSYPNPFTRSATIRYELGESTMVDLIVYDILGEAVAHLVQRENREAGSYQLNFDASSLSAGTYFLSFKTNSRQQTLKMIKID